MYAQIMCTMNMHPEAHKTSMEDFAWFCSQPAPWSDVQNLLRNARPIRGFKIKSAGVVALKDKWPSQATSCTGVEGPSVAEKSWLNGHYGGFPVRVGSLSWKIMKTTSSAEVCDRIQPVDRHISRSVFITSRED